VCDVPPSKKPPKEKKEHKKMKNINKERIDTSPMSYPQTRRPYTVQMITSGKAGKVLPLAAIPVLREDRLSRGQFRINLDMNETLHPLFNAVHVQAMAHFVPYLAVERFKDEGMMNRAYQQEPEVEGDPNTIIPFIQTYQFNRNDEFSRTLGQHAKDGQEVNAAYLEAYNLIVNYRRKMRSKHLSLRTPLDTTLATCFWKQPMNHIVPDFDDAMIDGEVPLELSGRIPVTGVGYGTRASDDVEPAITMEYIDTLGTQQGRVMRSSTTNGTTKNNLALKVDDNDIAQVYAELDLLQSSGVTLSLSNIELAKQTRAFAKMRKQYQGIDEEHLIDLLMDGITIPDQALKQPILLAKKSTIVGYNRRYSTSSGALDESVTTGETFLDLTMRMPKMSMGGVIIVTLEVVPERMFDRTADPLLTLTNVEKFPVTKTDYLDPRKVDVVYNQQIDMDHSDPDAIFGYEPMNAKWSRKQVNLGGKYYKPDASQAPDNERSKIWSIEKVDPELTENFYLAKDLGTEVFLDQTSDPLEIALQGQMVFIGNTQFGKSLDEASDDYQTIIEEVLQTDETTEPAVNEEN
jgi:hypothetical protein